MQQLETGIGTVLFGPLTPYPLSVDQPIYHLCFVNNARLRAGLRQSQGYLFNTPSIGSRGWKTRRALSPPMDKTIFFLLVRLLLMLSLLSGNHDLTQRSKIYRDGNFIMWNLEIREWLESLSFQHYPKIILSKMDDSDSKYSRSIEFAHRRNSYS